jgi:uncharacterized protein (DUF697 family)
MTDEFTRARITRITWQTSFASAALGAVLSPIPFADEVVLVPVYGIMAARIAKAHGVGLTEVPWKPIAGAITAGLATRAALGVAVAFIPGVAAVANAVSAAVLTRQLARYADKACREGMSAPASGFATA